MVAPVSGPGWVSKQEERQEKKVTQAWWNESKKKQCRGYSELQV